MVITAREKIALFTDRLLLHPGMKNNGLLSKSAVFLLQIYFLLTTGLAWILQAHGIRECGTGLLVIGMIAMLAHGISRRENKEGIIFSGLMTSMMLTGYFMVYLGGIASSGGLVMAGPVLVILSVLLLKRSYTNWLLAAYVAAVVAASLFPNRLSGDTLLTHGLNILFFTMNSILLAIGLGLLITTLFQQYGKAIGTEAARDDEVGKLLQSKTHLVRDLTDDLTTRLNTMQEAIDQVSTSRNGNKGEKLRSIQNEVSYIKQRLELQKELAEIESRTVRIRKVQADFIKFSQFIVGELRKEFGDKEIIYGSTISQLNLDFDPRIMARILKYLLAACHNMHTDAGPVKVDIHRRQENSWKDLLEIHISCKGKTFDENQKKLLTAPDYEGIFHGRGPADWLHARLLIAGELVRILDGKVIVKSRENKGTSIRMLVPAHNASRFVSFDELRSWVDLSPNREIVRRAGMVAELSKTRMN